ncbi:hypothetical protein M3202_12135 [Alkalihalobacillus oceani]|uniref:Uncharacterized protein n=1 Tax=Halalkalibacter oceani TaxID=1653776 RepID=A0A9X2INF9_9BACI|nr:hypothetical protein [Halalkalibacter oceani]MCM3714829.1 hypothetical protein [Halalkalibacter oceani]
MKKEVLTKKTLLSWLVLHRIYLGEETNAISTNLPLYFSLFKRSSTIRSKVNNLYKSLTYQGYLMPSYHHPQKPFTITMTGKEYLKVQCREWRRVIEAHLMCLDQTVQRCHSATAERFKSSLTEVDFPFIGQYLEYKKVLPFLIMKVMQGKSEACSASDLRQQLLKQFGWVCSMPTLTRLVEELVEGKELILINQQPDLKLYDRAGGNEAVFHDFRTEAIAALEAGREKLEEVRDYLNRYDFL